MKKIFETSTQVLLGKDVKHIIPNGGEFDGDESW